MGGGAVMRPPAAAPRVAVLLSTYNGEAFLAAQLDSLAEQEGVDVQVFARDDGSTDATRRILADYAGRWPALAAPAGGEPLGPARSFLALLGSAPDGFDHYAFCDQDDVWAPDKLARAAAVLAAQSADHPLLYCSRVRFADDQLRPLGESPLASDTRFEHLLFENIAFGNTVVLNAAARGLVATSPPGAGMIMHDWWCALVVSALGQVRYDPTPRVLYRQHRANVIGGPAGRLAEVRKHVRTFWRDPRRFYPIHGQATEFLRLFGDRLQPGQRAAVEALVGSRGSLAKRLRYALSGPMVRARPIDAIAGRLLLAAGLY